jgi:plastocyanin
MRERLWLGVAAALLLLARPVFAGSADVAVMDRSGRPLADAVVELSARAPQPATAPARQAPGDAIIDQRHETFLPLVTVVRKGGHVTFTNNDTTMHQVYSFSPVKQFAFEIDEGQRSTPVVFDKPGVVPIGCNIHDRMITYVYVADSPLATKTDRAGLVAFAELAPGSYRGTVWHPQLAPGAAPQAFSFVVADGHAKTTVTLPFNAAIAPAKKSMHMQMY